MRDITNKSNTNLSTSVNSIICRLALIHTEKAPMTFYCVVEDDKMCKEVVDTISQKFGQEVSVLVIESDVDLDAEKQILDQVATTTKDLVLVIYATVLVTDDVVKACQRRLNTILLD